MNSLVLILKDLKFPLKSPSACVPTSVHHQGCGLPVLSDSTECEYISICRQNLLTVHCSMCLLASQPDLKGSLIPSKRLHLSWKCWGVELILLHVSLLSTHWGDDFRYILGYGPADVYCSFHTLNCTVALYNTTYSLGCITLHVHQVTDRGGLSFLFPSLYDFAMESPEILSLASLCWGAWLQNREKTLLNPTSGGAALTEFRSPSKSPKESKLLTVASNIHSLFPLAA